jgi:D-2-hydroxyacid dehydrogenase (NADP+)
MKVLVANYSDWSAWDTPGWVLERMRAAVPGVEFVHARTPDEGVRKIPDAEVVFSSVVRPEMLDAAGRLRWIHSPAAGIGGMLFPSLVASDVILTNSRGMHAETIAEHVIALTLALFRGLPTAVRRQSERMWAQEELSVPGPRLLRGSTMGIVGLGGIGAAIAAAASGLGMRVEGIRRRANAELPPGVDAAYPIAAMHERLPHWDVVVLAAPQTHETQGLIGAPELALMRRNAILVNIARGKLVREVDLIDALARGVIGGAALDVVEHEPLDPASPLWSMPNVLITPHVAGFRPQYWERLADLFLENLRRYRANEPLLNVVDKQAGY